jgi:hypothetical protein
MHGHPQRLEHDTAAQMLARLCTQSVWCLPHAQNGVSLGSYDISESTRENRSTDRLGTFSAAPCTDRDLAR